MANCQVIESSCLCLNSILLHLSSIESIPFCPHRIRSGLFGTTGEAPCITGLAKGVPMGKIEQHSLNERD